MTHTILPRAMPPPPRPPDNTPILVGGGRRTYKNDLSGAADPDEVLARAPDPIALMAMAAERAALDTGLPEAVLWPAVDVIGTVNMQLELRMPRGRGPLYTNPARSLGRRLGATGVRREFLAQGHSGHSPQMMVNEVAAMVARGEAKCALLSGCECLDTFMKALKRGWGIAGVPRGGGGGIRDAQGRVVEAKDAGRTIEWGDEPDDGAEPEIMAGVHSEELPVTGMEVKHGLVSASNFYALMEQAQRRELGRSVEEQVRRRERGQLGDGVGGR